MKLMEGRASMPRLEPVMIAALLPMLQRLSALNADISV